MNVIIWTTSLFGLLMVNTVVFKGCQCQDLIGPSPEQAAVIGQTLTTLTCSKDPSLPNTLSWFDVLGDGYKQIFFGTDKSDFDAKYNNFGVVSATAEQLNLQITDIAVEDEGTYRCQLVGTVTQEEVIFTVEVRSSSLAMTQGGSGTTLITVREGETSEIKCTSIGARPVVTIVWYHMKDGGSETKITDGVSQVNTPNADNTDTSDSVSTLNYTTTDEYHEGTLTCVTTGHEVAGSRHDAVSLNVQYPPEITYVNYANEVIICNAEANPEVTSYAIIVNYSEVFDPLPGCSGSECRFSYTVTEEYTNIRCNATNELGMHSDFAIARPGATTPPQTTTSHPTRTTKPGANCGGLINTAAIILVFLLGISIVIIIIMLLYILSIRNTKSTTKDVPAQVYMDLNPHTKEDKTVYQELDNNAKCTQGAVTQVYEVIS